MAALKLRNHSPKAQATTLRRGGAGLAQGSDQCDRFSFGRDYQPLCVKIQIPPTGSGQDSEPRADHAQIELLQALRFRDDLDLDDLSTVDSEGQCSQ